MSAVATRSGPRYRAATTPASSAEFGPYEWAFAGVAVQTILFNPVVGSAGPLAVYLSALTWPLLFGLALLSLMSSADPRLRRAIGAVVSSTALVFGLIAVQLGLLGIQVYTFSTLPKLAYIPAGIVAALCAYRSADRLLDLIVVVLGLKCTLLLADALQGPIDLLHRLNPASLGGANTFAMLVGLLVVLRLSTWILEGKRPGPLVLLSLPPSVAAMSITFTRSALVAFVVALAVLLVLSIGRRGARAGVLAGIVAVGMGCLLLLQAPVRERLASLTGGASSGRDDILEAAWQGISESPVIGHGFGSFQFSSPFIVEFSGAGANTTPSAHNIFLQVAYEGGIVGFVAVVAAVCLLLRPCWSTLLMPVIAMLTVDGMFETFPYVVQTSWVIGVVLAVGLHHRRAAEDPAPSGGPP